MTPKPPITAVIEVVRTDAAGGPYAFDFAPRDYLFRSSEAGYREARFKWDSAMQERLRSLQRTRPDAVAMQAVAQDLFRFLPDNAIDHQGILDAPDETRVVISLRSNAAEIYALPWELLPVGQSGFALADRPNCLLRYEWPETQTKAPAQLPAPEGGRILFAWSDAGGDVPDREHREAIAVACAAGRVSFDPAVDEVAGVSYALLDERLRAASAAGRPVTVLHLLCHGGALKSETEAYGLIWHGDGMGLPRIVPADRLAALVGCYAGTLRLVVIAACQAGNTGTPGNPMGSVAQRLHRAGLEAVIASRLPLSIPGSSTLARTFYARLLRDPASVETAFLAARQQLAVDHSETADWSALQLHARERDGCDTRPIVFRPYLGLQAFDRDHERFFFGRVPDIDVLEKRLLEAASGALPRFQVLAAASGTGKSSLVLGGVLPRLERRGWGHRVLRPADLEGGRAAAVTEDPRIAAATAAKPFLLVVDQFEELFTRVTTEARDTTAQAMWGIARRPFVLVLCTMRVDYLGRCGEVVIDGEIGRRLESVVYDDQHRTFLGQMDPTAMREAIEGPARQVGLEVQHGLSDRLLDEVAGQPGALPLLAFALDALWAKRIGRTLTHTAYDEIGGAVAALAAAADSVLAGLAAGEEQRQARRLLVALIELNEGAADSRRRVHVPELRPTAPELAAAFDHVAEVLSVRRLVVNGDDRTPGGRGPWMELAHDELVHRWKTLRTWASEDRELELQKRALEEKAEVWARRPPGEPAAPYLLTGAPLQRAKQVVAHAGASERIVRFLAASDESDLDEMGWGVIAPSGARGDRLLELCAPLINARREHQGGRDVRIYRVPGPMNETEAVAWRLKVYMDPTVHRAERPRYLLILGDLDEVSLELQQEMASDVMIGRIAFTREEDYATYAEKVVRFEGVVRDEAPRLLFLTVDPEPPTPAILDAGRKFIRPCIDGLEKADAAGQRPAVTVENWFIEDEHCDSLLQCVDELAPSILFSVCMDLRLKDPTEAEARELLGSIVVGKRKADPGVMTETTTTSRFGRGSVLTGEHLRGRRFVTGGLWLLFTCYGAGVPRSTAYRWVADFQAPRGITPSTAERPFVTALPQSALASDAGPLAFFGCADILYNHSYCGDERWTSRVDPFVEALRDISAGGRFGSIVLRFQQEIAALTSELMVLLERRISAEGRDAEDSEAEARKIARTMQFKQVRRHALRSFILLGDPATRLPVGAHGDRGGPASQSAVSA